MDTFKIRVVENDGDRFSVSKKNDIAMSVPYDDSNRKIHIGLSNSENVLSVGVTETIVEKDLKVKGSLVDAENNQYVTFPIRNDTLEDLCVTPEKLFAYTGLNTSNTSIVMSQSPVVYYPNIRGELVISKLNSNSNLGNIDVLSEVQARNVIPGQYRDGTFIYNNLNINSKILTDSSFKIESKHSTGANDRGGFHIDNESHIHLYAPSLDTSSYVALGFSATETTYYDILVVKHNTVEIDSKLQNNNSIHALKINNGGLHIDANNINGDTDEYGNSSLMNKRNTVQILNSKLGNNINEYDPLTANSQKVRMKIGKDIDNCMNIWYSKCDDSNRDAASISLSSGSVENVNNITIHPDSVLVEKSIYNKVNAGDIDSNGITPSNILQDVLSLSPKLHNNRLSISPTDLLSQSSTILSKTVKSDNYVGYIDMIPHLIQCIKELHAMIAYNASNIAVNASNIIVNKDAIDQSTSNIAVNASNIVVNKDAIDQNTSNIAVNASNIVSNIDQNTSNIDQNTSNIDQNTSTMYKLVIYEQASNIDLNSSNMYKPVIYEQV